MVLNVYNDEISFLNSDFFPGAISIDSGYIIMAKTDVPVFLLGEDLIPC